MRALIILIIFLISIPILSQSANELLDSGYQKQQKMNILGAIDDYTLAIEADPSYIKAYFNRALCYSSRSEFTKAIEDFEEILEIDPNHKETYYQLAVSYIKIEEYDEARESIDKAISLDSKLPNALTLRGQLRIAANDLKGACEDFNSGVQNNDQGALKLQLKYCSEESLKEEIFNLDWTDYKNWKLGDKQESKVSVVYDYIREDENLDNWTELINSTQTPLNQKLPMHYLISLMKEQSTSRSETSVFTILELDSMAENGWVIFKIENNTTPEYTAAESQLWYLIQGKKGVYLNFWTNRKDSITDEEVEEWSAFFKKSYFTYE
ncbi:MAG: tetratricopeptide repeat protein [Candidatus Kapaibacterium sp.]